MFSQDRVPKVAIIHPAFGESQGGSQIFVMELTERLKGRCNITILSGNKVNDLCKPVFSLPRRNRTLNNNYLYNTAINLLSKKSNAPELVIEHLSSFFPVLFELLTGNYDVIFPNNDWGGLLVAGAVRKIKGTPILFTEHCGLIDNGKIASRNLKFNPDKYIVLSQDMEFWVKKHFENVNVEYIPNGIDFNRFNPSIEHKIINMPRPIFLTAGRCNSNKRLDLIIEAVARLDKGSLLILTTGEDIESINQKGQALLGRERFRLLSVPYDEIASYYRTCDVFTLPSIYEPFGLVYLEAMACNKPIVAPDDPARREIIGQAGILCDVNDLDIYADSLIKSTQIDYGNTPFNQAQKYSWDITADRYFQCILSLCK